MKSLLLYFIQVIVASGLLYAYYHWVLRNKEFHQYNRFYLLSAAIISLLLPLLQIPVYFESQSAISPDLWLTLQALYGSEGSEVMAVKQDTGFSIGSILWLIYSVIVLILVSRIILGLRKIKQLLQRNKIETLQGIRFVNTDEPGTPFTFFRWLFWDKKIDLNSASGQQIFRHEVYHIQQKHSWDLMILEILRTIFWINPFFHLMKKEQTAIHEFLADQFAVTHHEKWEYAEFLLMQALQTKHKLVHPFFQSQIKRRIAMITNSQKTSHRYLRKVAALPLAALVLGLVAFQVKEKVMEVELHEIPVEEILTGDQNMKAAGSSPLDITLHELLPTQVLPALDTTPVKKVKAEGLFIADTITITDAGKKNSVVLRSTSGNTSVQPLYVVDGVKLTNLSDISEIDPNNIQSINVIKDKSAIDKYGSEGKNGVIEIVTKNKTNIFKTEPKEVVVTGYPVKNDDKEPLYVVNGVKAPAGTINEIDPNTIKSVTVLKDKSATDKYGSEATNGVIEIKLKPSGDTDTKNAEQKEVTVTGFRTATSGDMKEVTVTGYRNPSAQGAVFNVAEIPAVPAGGEEGWKNHLGKNLNASVPNKHNAPPGKYTVKIQFIIEKDGSVSQLSPLTTHGYGMEEEAMRVIQLSPRWEPAKQNDLTVRSFRTQPISFMVDNSGDIKIMPREEGSLVVFPNPASKDVTVTLETADQLTGVVRILTMAGTATGIQKQVNISKGKSQVSLSTSSLKPGTYIVQLVTNDKKTLSQKLVIK